MHGSGIYSQDSKRMMKMAVDGSGINGNSGIVFGLFLRSVVDLVGENGLLYFNIAAGFIASYMLSTLFDKRSVINLLAFWIMLTPAFIVFNFMIWTDVLFVYAICISIVLLVKAEKAEGDKRLLSIMAIASIFLLLVTHIRLNGSITVMILMLSFMVTGKNIKYKLSTLIVVLVLSSLITTYVKSNNEVSKTTYTIGNFLKRMVENDYMYHMFCIKKAVPADIKLKNNQPLKINHRFCNNSFFFDKVKNQIHPRHSEKLYARGIKTFTSNPFNWLKIKLNQSLPYITMERAYIFPLEIMRVNYIDDNGKGVNWFYKILSGIDAHKFKKICIFVLSPIWIWIFAVYVVFRIYLLRTKLIPDDKIQSGILNPIALFSVVFYFSLSIIYITNDTRYFLPATFVSIYMFIVVFSNDIKYLLSSNKEALSNT